LKPELVELVELLVGTWRVHGPAIEGRAEYQETNDGRLLVAYVDFVVRDSRIRVIQHIWYDDDRNAVLARYMDTTGGEATYAWVLDGGTIRVSLDDEDSTTYFQATLNEARSQYIGTWHYPEGTSPETAETIIYTRVDGTD
jgi:hypothetical protein